MLPPEEIAELDRRWALVEAGEATMPHDEVVRWADLGNAVVQILE
ncbi:MAG TPA: hypothetical protein VIY51_21885 [Xanthobacteraceae bacterium]